MAKKCLINKADEKTKDKKGSEKDCCDFSALGHELVSLVQSAKTKYDQTDDKTKKAIIAGAAGAIALIAGVIGYNKSRKKN